jgi:protocatechuate 3,4-dioxygenase beta subunit
LVRDFTLTVGKSRTLSIHSADGKIPNKLFGAGQTGSMWATPVTGDMLKLTGLTPKRTRAVVLMDEAKTVGAVASVTGDVETPTSVKLEKLGSIEGRVLDADGAPAPGADVQVWLELDREKYDNLPLETSAILGVNGIAPGAWSSFTSRMAKTDKDGRFALNGLLPGQKYRLIAGYNPEKKDGEILHERTDISVKSGEARDLGDLKPKK